MSAHQLNLGCERSKRVRWRRSGVAAPPPASARGFVTAQALWLAGSTRVVSAAGSSAFTLTSTPDPALIHNVIPLQKETKASLQALTNDDRPAQSPRTTPTRHQHPPRGSAGKAHHQYRTRKPHHASQQHKVHHGSSTACPTVGDARRSAMRQPQCSPDARCDLRARSSQPEQKQMSNAKEREQRCSKGDASKSQAKKG